MAPFIPEAPILKAQQYEGDIYFDEFESFNLDDESPVTKIKKIRRRNKRNDNFLKCKHHELIKAKMQDQQLKFFN